jgi:hypothetical protein
MRHHWLAFLEGTMDVFELRNLLVGDYASYTRSFIKIADPRIRAKVDSDLEAGAFWPEPLLQLNPTLKRGGTIDDLGRGSSHPQRLTALGAIVLTLTFALSRRKQGFESPRERQ